jgi:hypothetical protein
MQMVARDAALEAICQPGTTVILVSLMAGGMGR